jgi:hypothetical protein
VTIKIFSTVKKNDIEVQPVPVAAQVRLELRPVLAAQEIKE